MIQPLCFDLCAGLGGWAEGFLAEGWLWYDWIWHTKRHRWTNDFYRTLKRLTHVGCGRGAKIDSGTESLASKRERYTGLTAFHTRFLSVSSQKVCASYIGVTSHHAFARTICLSELSLTTYVIVDQKGAGNTSQETSGEREIQTQYFLIRRSLPCWRRLIMEAGP